MQACASTMYSVYENKKVKHHRGLYILQDALNNNTVEAKFPYTAIYCICFLQTMHTAAVENKNRGCQTACLPTRYKHCVD